MMSFPYQCLDQRRSLMELDERRRTESKQWTWTTVKATKKHKKNWGGPLVAADDVSRRRRRPRKSRYSVSVFCRKGGESWKDFWSSKSTAMQQSEKKGTGPHWSWNKTPRRSEKMKHDRDSWRDKTTLDIFGDDWRERCSLVGNGWTPIPS